MRTIKRVRLTERELLARMANRERLRWVSAKLLGYRVKGYPCDSRQLSLGSDFLDDETAVMVVELTQSGVLVDNNTKHNREPIIDIELA